MTERADAGVRLNAHLVVDGALAEYCARVNERLRERYRTAIIFGSDSPMQPHVTLVMGTPSEGLSAETVRKTLRHAVATGRFGAVPVHLGPSVITEDGYVLRGVEAVPEYERLRQVVREALLPSLAQGEGRRIDWPHLTLAKLAGRWDDAEELVAALGAPPEFQARNVALSVVGPHGTCIERIACWRLRTSGGSRP